ncbi:MAG: hypothetical protein ABI200_06045, partial [Gaiellales bacterium]
GATSCTPGLLPGGVQTGWFRETGKADEFYGIATDGVDSVVLNTSNGEHVAANVSKNGAFWWTAPSTAVTVTSVTSSHDGVKSTNDIPADIRS